MGYTTPKTWSAATLTVSDMNIYNRDNIAFLKENIALDAAVELTISAGGAVTKTKSYHHIDTASDDPTDDLDTINGGSDGDILLLHAEHTDRTIVLKNETGNLHISADITLDNDHKIVELMYDGQTSEWHLIGDIAKTREWPMNTFIFPNPGTDWSASLLGATLAQNKTAKLFWIPLHGLILGDGIVSYKLVGDATEGTALTLDCKLVRINKADPITSSDIAGGGIAQVTATGNFDVAAVLTAVEMIATDKQYILQVTATTTGSDSLVVMGAEVKTLSLS